jgi:hypothetical protein
VGPSKNPLQAVDLDDLERQIREIAPRRSDNRLAELGRIVGWKLGGVRVDAVRAGPVAALAPPAMKKRGQGRAHALGLAVPILLVTVGVGVAVAMRAGPVNVVESTAPVIKADDAPAQDSQVTSPDLQTPSQSAMGAAVSPPEPDVVGTTTPPRSMLRSFRPLPLCQPSPRMSRCQTRLGLRP